MNSEKVKEIKDSIQRKINRAEKGKDDFVNCVSVDMLKMYLTLINELESENERLENKNYRLEQDLGQCENGYKLELHTARYQLHNANEDLKKAEKRIAELEKENAKLLDSVETVQNNRCTTKCELTKNALKQFGKKFELNIGKHLKKKHSDYRQDSFYYIVDKADVDMCLDKTLKECLCDNHQ